MQPVIDGLLQQGLPGLIIITLGFACYKLYNKYDEVQEKRIAESREVVKAIEQNTNTMDTLTELLRDRKAG